MMSFIFSGPRLAAENAQLVADNARLNHENENLVRVSEVRLRGSQYLRQALALEQDKLASTEEELALLKTKAASTEEELAALKTKAAFNESVSKRLYSSSIAENLRISNEKNGLQCRYERLAAKLAATEERAAAAEKLASEAEKLSDASGSRKRRRNS